MKTLTINMPFTGSYYVELEVPDDFEDTEKNVENAFYEYWDDNDGAFKDFQANSEWEFTRVVAQGNVTHALLNDMDWNLEDQE